MSSRLKLLVGSMFFAFLIIALATLIFGLTPPTKAEFLILTLMGAWCADKKDGQP